MMPYFYITLCILSTYFYISSSMLSMINSRKSQVSVPQDLHDNLLIEYELELMYLGSKFGVPKIMLHSLVLYFVLIPYIASRGSK